MRVRGRSGDGQVILNLSLNMLDVKLVFTSKGLAVGGGAELTTATDWRLVTPQARVAWVQVTNQRPSF